MTKIDGFEFTPGDHYLVNLMDNLEINISQLSGYVDVVNSTLSALRDLLVTDYLSICSYIDRFVPDNTSNIDVSFVLDKCNDYMSHYKKIVDNILIKIQNIVIESDKVKKLINEKNGKLS